VIAGTCEAVDPPTVRLDGDHRVVCHLYGEKAAEHG
jgi:hypothetical protein